MSASPRNISCCTASWGWPEAKISRLAADILARQLDHGGWSIWHGDGGELSASVEAYLALKIAGFSPQDPRMAKAREFILARGGALKTRVFTRIFLALFGQISWDGIPLLPVEFILLPPWSGLSIYEFSSWTRATYSASDDHHGPAPGPVAAAGTIGSGAFSRPRRTL